jgi:Anti-sigma-K factor rskA
VPHTDPDALCLLALGEQVDDEVTDHVRTCPRCADELAALRDVVTLGRESQQETELPAPSPEVWDRIAAETDQRQDPIPIARRGFGRLVAVAAAALLIGATGGVLAVKTSTPTPAAEQVVAQATLAAQPQAPTQAGGSAEVLRTDSGLRLRVRLSGMPAPEGLYQVWLYDGGQVMIPVGVIGSDTQVEMPIPGTVDLDRYPVVDVSAQRLGQQEHGQSMVQGRFDT